MLCTENLGVVKGLLFKIFMLKESLLSPVFLPGFCVEHCIPARRMRRVCFLLCLLLHTEGCEEQEILFCSLCSLRLAQGPCPGRCSVNAEERSGRWSLRSWYAQVDISAALCILSLCLDKGKNILWTGCGGIVTSCRLFHNVPGEHSCLERALDLISKFKNRYVCGLVYSCS